MHPEISYITVCSKYNAIPLKCANEGLTKIHFMQIIQA